MESVSPEFCFWNLVTFVPLLMNFFTCHPKTLRNFQKYHQKENIFYLALAILFGYLHYSITIIPLLRMQCTFCNNSNNNRHFPLSASYLVGRVVDFNVECKVNTHGRRSRLKSTSATSRPQSLFFGYNYLEANFYSIASR